MKKTAYETGKKSDRRAARNIGQIIERDLGDHTTYDYIKEHTEIIIKKINMDVEYKEIYSVAEELKNIKDSVIVKALKSNIFKQEDVDKFTDHLRV